MIGMDPVRPDLLSDLPARVAAALHVVLPALRTCEAKHGRLDVGEIEAMGKAAPAVLVSRLGLRQRQETTGGPYFDAEMSAFIFTRHAMGLDRMTAALAISQAVITRVADARWGLAEADAAYSVTEQVLETDATRKAQIALIAVSWLQPVRLSVNPVPPHAVPPELYATDRIREAGP